MKRPYEAPRLTVYGDIREVTRTGFTGDYTDWAFPVNTKRGDLTFHSG